MLNWFLRKESKTYAIEKFKSFNSKESLEKELTNEIWKIDQGIARATKELLQAQAVAVKATLSRNNSLLYKIQKKLYWSQVQDSASWHRTKIIQLHQERWQLQTKLDRLTGKFWRKRIQKSLLILLLGAITIFALWIIIMGFIATLYLLPIWGSILLVFIIFQRKSIKF
jgi:hypothetical protein